MDSSSRNVTFPIRLFYENKFLNEIKGKSRVPDDRISRITMRRSNIDRKPRSRPFRSFIWKAKYSRGKLASGTTGSARLMFLRKLSLLSLKIHPPVSVYTHGSNTLAVCFQISEQTSSNLRKNCNLRVKYDSRNSNSFSIESRTIVNLSLYSATNSIASICQVILSEFQGTVIRRGYLIWLILSSNNEFFSRYRSN